MGVRGHPHRGGVPFEWSLEFSTHVENLDDETIEGIDDVRRVFKITIKRDGRPIEMTEDIEYGFFFAMLVEFAGEFYHNSQTRSSQEGFMGEAMRGEGAAAAFGVTALIGAASDNTYDLPPNVCEMLSQPKFGCSLTI